MKKKIFLKSSFNLFTRKENSKQSPVRGHYIRYLISTPSKMPRLLKAKGD